MNLPDKLEKKYEQVGTLATGSSGIVVEAVNRSMRQQRVAIKLLSQLSLDDEEARKRFRREAEVVCSLRHWHIVHIYDYDEDESTAWIVMEWIDGGSLKTILDRGEQFPLEEVVRLMGQLLEALAYAHQRGVVHRDVKPGNILLTPDRNVKLADFGIAKTDSSDLTQYGSVMGTPAYMAPEQLRGETEVDRHADLWAAGVILYQLLTGKKPFDAYSQHALMQRILSEEPKAPSLVSDTVPGAFDAVMRRALAKHPEDRYPSASDLASAIRGAVAGKDLAAPLVADDDATVTSKRNAAPIDAVPQIEPFNPPLWVSAGTPAGEATHSEIRATPDSPPPRREPRATVPESASKARVSRRRVYLGGTLAAILVALAAFFMIRPGDLPAPGSDARRGSSDERKEAQAPPTAPPSAAPRAREPGPTTLPPHQFAAEAKQALSAMDCAWLDVRLDGNTAVVSGHVAAASDLPLIGEKLGRLPGVQAVKDTDVRVVPPPHCRALSFFGPYVDPDASAPRIRLKGGAASITEGRNVVVEVIGGSFPGFVYADLYDTEGNVAHLLPNSEHTRNRAEPRQQFTLGERGMKWKVEPPLGRHLLVVMASRTPLFNNVREQDVEAGEAYFRALDETMAQPRTEHGLVVHYTLVDFVPRK